jgi:hypothetical protein
MSTVKSESLSDVWAARYDDRDDEDLACEMWARRLASRDLAMAQPFKDFPMPEETPGERDRPEAPADTSHPR